MNRKSRIEEILSHALSPLHLDLVDESHMHSVPPGAESHFRVLIASEAFQGSTLVARHRRLNTLLAEEFQTGLHALAIHAWTPEEWFAKGGVAPASPPCLGGQKVGDTDTAPKHS
jgi:BolA family transcriptional regulator, general stress-responsive regulator